MTETPNQKLLTIAIPTYNRAQYLDINLNQIWKQIEGNENTVEILVANNDSKDNTEDIVKNYVLKGFNITYIRNSSNIGATENVIQCFSRAHGKYVLVLADDDCLINGSLKKILKVLSTGNYGNIFLSAYNYSRDFIKERPLKHSNLVLIYRNKTTFVKRVSFYSTFLSGNIVNKSILDRTLNLREFSNTQLPQMAWILSALFSPLPNVIMEDRLVAVKLDNSGNYPFCKIFGEQFVTIQKYFIKNGVPKRYFDIINTKMQQYYFAPWIMGIKKNVIKGYTLEDYYKTLYPLFKNYISFWIFTFPILKFPVFMLTMVRKFQNLMLLFSIDHVLLVFNNLRKKMKKLTLIGNTSSKGEQLIIK